MIIAVDLERLAELARTEAGLHPIRTPQRRAAAALWVALTTTPTITAAKAALGDFTTPATEADAMALLHELASGTRKTSET